MANLGVNTKFVWRLLSLLISTLVLQWTVESLTKNTTDYSGFAVGRPTAHFTLHTHLAYAGLRLMRTLWLIITPIWFPGLARALTAGKLGTVKYSFYRKQISSWLL